jgi:hypothetical protein
MVFWPEDDILKTPGNDCSIGTRAAVGGVSRVTVDNVGVGGCVVAIDSVANVVKMSCSDDVVQMMLREIGSVMSGKRRSEGEGKDRNRISGRKGAVWAMNGMAALLVVCFWTVWGKHPNRVWVHAPTLMAKSWPHWRTEQGFGGGEGAVDASARLHRGKAISRQRQF